MQNENELGKLNIDETIYETEVPDSFNRRWTPPDIRLVNAFIPGTVVEVKTTAGTVVKAGDVLLILDAMKMYNEITAPVSGTVDVVAVSAGERVEKNQLLVRLK
ncbi:MAG: acetyl-CoA carboxylase biotin carboxyl carrier protein subunit [Candidatus Fermentibacteraceae bacterium]|nr:acetyl-CoA carboxylase biotin carboxyl carrier protein subunit [Candidatus Fermentibacteraceae bacterium]